MKTFNPLQPTDPPQMINRPLLPRCVNALPDDGLSPGKRTDDLSRYRSPSAPPLTEPVSRTLSPDPVTPMATKVCVKCKQEKPLLEFHKNSRSSDGLHSYCKECNRAQALAHIRAEKARKALLRAAKKAAANH